MGFLQQFSKYFSAQERESELYNLWSAIGVNMEKALLEEQSKINTEFTDISNFSEDTIRSWLAFFLMKIPYRTSAVCQMSVGLAKNKYKRVIIPQYSQLTTENGLVFTQMRELVLYGTDKQTITLVQGSRVVERGVYNTLIKIQAKNPDLSYLTVKIGSGEKQVEIPEVSYQSSFDSFSHMGSWSPKNPTVLDVDGRVIELYSFGGTPQLRDGFGTKGYMYEVISDGLCKFSEDGEPVEVKQGDLLIYDGSQWVRNAYTNKLRPIQLSNSYGIPSNGYFAYYYDNYLYIKIFSGTEVDNPEGEEYEISYIQSDGVQGTITKDDELTYINSFKDEDENDVEIEYAPHGDSTNGVNQPTRGKLSLMLKQCLYSSTTISSVPEYTNWFRAQPEVGDALVLSDFEKYLKKSSNGSSDFSSDVYEYTGRVDVYLIGTDGKTALSSATIDELFKRIEPYKDIAFLYVNDFKVIKNHIEVEYVSSTTRADEFERYVKDCIAKFYNVDEIKLIGESLFTDLDLTAVANAIYNGEHSSTGLIVKGYHYYEHNIGKDDVSLPITLQTYADESVAYGFYDIVFNRDGLTETVRLVELETANKSIASIQNENPIDTYVYGNNNGVSQIVTLQSLNKLAPIGWTDYSITVKCYWAMKNEGILSIGSEAGLRNLESVVVRPASSGK